MGTDVVTNTVAFNDDQLAAIDSFAAALATLDTLGIKGESIADYGTGFRVVDKKDLVGVPMVLLQWRFNEGDFDGDFVSVEAVTKHGEKVIFNDGSTGICRELHGVTNTRAAAKHPTPQAGLLCEGGLMATNYYFNAETRETRSKAPESMKGWAPASTYYLSA